MLTQAEIAALTSLAGTLLLAIFFVYLYAVKRQNYLLIWAAGWGAVALNSAVRVVDVAAGPHRWARPAEAWLIACGAILFLSAAQLYARATIHKFAAWALAGLAALWVISYALGWISVPLDLGIALLLFAAAGVFWQVGRKEESTPDVLLAIALALWGALTLTVLLEGRLAHVEWANIHLLFLIPQLFCGVLMVMAGYEEERHRIERNMLALSNLNLATSSFSGEIQRMLAQALDRVLNVARIPSGVLCLHYGDTRGPVSIVTTGLDTEFSKRMLEENLEDHIVMLVARLGGLVVLRDLTRAELWQALDREPAFRRVRELLLQQNLRTVVGISLQARERVLGALLLATPDQRQFTPAELRLLLALGYQIGVAVENSYLIQQTARRSEELNILNEIGRALSSTLDTDKLFEKIYAEMRRLFDVSRFYIAMYDNPRETIRFELDVVDNAPREKHSRKFGNGLTEYMIRNRQPVLIRENFASEVERLGTTSGREAGCFCGVPLILYDRAIGAMAIHSKQERAFDEGHLELMRVLASQACIAMENARLFAEEQKKARHLTLLNNISGHAISTLKTEEMLAKVAEELGQVLAYDHIGIATVLDGSAKELVVQVEAGERRGATGKRIAFGEGLIGAVARTEKMEMVREIAPSSLQPVLGGSASAIALPINSPERLLGVFYAESSKPAEFLSDEVQLLRTLADLFAGALQNAESFQKAQEQAITDGLTGVKTHRYLMEELTKEWKRSSRTGRPFALALMDLDRFKFVNDFYGHLEGDKVLQRVGAILDQNCRRSDVVARYGGDEFVILMTETSVEQAQQIAEKLRGWVASDPLLRDKNITASFGIACYPIHGSAPQELIQGADASMYLSKHQGGNAVFTAAERCEPGESKEWKRDVLEAYLGVVLHRQFTTGPEAFNEIHRRIEQFSRSLPDKARSAPFEQLPPTILEAMTSLACAVDEKDQYTHGHSRKVSGYAAMIAQAAGLKATEVEEVRLAALLHDVGKVGVPEEILNKAGPLSADEWEIMKSHTILGWRILDPLQALRRLREMVKHHHEFFDGSGYPEGLERESIPFGARIVAIADAYDTITSPRVYKKPRLAEDALAEIQRCAGAQFDPDLVRVFVEAIRRQPHPILESVLSGQESDESDSF